MLLFLYLSILALNLLLIIIKKKNRLVIILTFIFIFIFMAGNTYNSDYAGYERYYILGSFPSSMEIGYTNVALFCREIGLKYSQFLYLYFGGLIILLAIALYRFCPNCHIALTLYLTYMVFWDTVQLRQFFVNVLYIFMIYALSKKKRIIFMFLTIVAGLIHQSALIYLIYLFINPDKKYSIKLGKKFTIGLLIVCIFVFIAGNRIPILYTLASRFLASSGKDIYFLTSTNFGFIITFISQFLNIGIAWIANSYIEENKVFLSSKMVKFTRTIYLVTLFSSFALPLLMLNNNFIRYVRVNNILIYILIAFTADISMKNKVSKLQIEYKLRKTIAFRVSNFRVHLTVPTYFILIIVYTTYWTFIQGTFGIPFDMFNNNFFI